MWVLSCESGCLGGKRTWLRPGSESFLGRTSGRGSSGELRLFIEDKSVSRTHLILRVNSVQPGDALLLHKRQCIELEDKSKTGSTINEERFVKATRSLEPGKYTIRLGHYQPAFHLEWHPVVLSITNLSKGAKKSGGALAPYQTKLEAAGVKLATTYITNVTTHVIAKKRNTAIGLQALLQARWLLTDSFIDALSSACHQQSGTNADGQPIQARLEVDFDAGWPREDEYIVPIGDEPTKKPNEFLRPNHDRNTIFRDFSFVFLSQPQYEQLMPVITTGGGKAVLCQYVSDETDVQDVVSFVADLAGKKEKRNFKLSHDNSPGGVVVVRIGDSSLGRSTSFMHDLDLALDQRSIEQSEFFGVIVENDSSNLRQPLREASASVGSDQAAASASPILERSTRVRQDKRVLQGDAVENDAQPPRKRVKRLATQSRFKGFDDFDPSQIVKDDSASPEPDQQGVEDVAANVTESKGGAEDARYMEQQQDAPAGGDHDDDQAMLDDLLPGAAALKRRRTAALQNGQKDIFTHADKNTGMQHMHVQGKTKTRNDLSSKDIKAELRKRREKEDEERRKDEEYLQTALDVDISQLKDLAIIETYQLPERASHGSEVNQTGGDRWDPAWNGRKNFKKFRPRGQRGVEDAGPQLAKVFVRLEEVSGRNGSHSDDYWLQSRSTARDKRRDQSQPQNEQNGHDDDDVLAFRRRIERSRAEDAVTADAELDSATISATNRSRPSPSQASESAASRTIASKRNAAQPPTGAPAAKRSRIGTTRVLTSVSDDEDPLAFRRKRR